VRFKSPTAVVAGAVVAGFFVARAATGIPAGWAYARGREAEAAGRYAEAAPLLDAGTLGANTNEALWLAGESRLAAWDGLSTAERADSRADRVLSEAVTRFLSARAGSPASAWFISALGDVYTRRAMFARSQATADLAALAAGPWALVGDDGRIAIGLTRAAILREPNRFDYRDQLVLLLEANGLHDDALRAIDESARALPDFGAHPTLTFEELPKDLVERFWQTARAIPPGDATMLSRERGLLANGQLGRRLGHLDEAEQDLRAALNAPGTPLNRAEDAFHLGLVLFDRGRFDEAESMFARANREPVFASGVAEMRAHIAEKQERWGEALDRYREVRRLRPRELATLFAVARLAEKSGGWGEAEEALRWAAMIHPEDPAPRRALVEMLVAQGDHTRARQALDDYVRLFGRTDDAARLEQSLASAVDPALH
jgi:tetratricopeptide (TPR) repeat protein